MDPGKVAMMSDGARPGRGPMQLRIAYLMSQFPVPTQTFAVSDIEALQADGHAVHVFAMKPCGSGQTTGIASDHLSFRGALGWPRTLWRLRGAVVDLIGTILRTALASPKQSLIALACLPRAAEITDRIERGRFDIAHLFWARHAALVLALLERRDWPGKRSVFAGAYDLVADDLFLKLALRSAQVAFTHCAANVVAVQGRAPPGLPLAVAYRGIPLLPHDPEAERDPDVWLTASALVKEKNVEAVLAAFAQARAQRPELCLRIFGEGPERGRLEARADALGLADAIAFEGHRPRVDVFDAMQRADTFLLLSRKSSERLPNVIKEALWAGCRVISSNTIGIEELLADDDLGLVVDPSDQRQVARAIRNVLARDRTCDGQRRDLARRWIAERFSATANMRTYVSHWTGRRADIDDPISRIASFDQAAGGFG